MGQNTLYYGDNLEILRRYIEDESVDLIYLDPPFNSNADYNVLFAEKDGTQAHAQITAFEDTWTWDLEAAQEYAEVLRSGHDRVAKCLKGIHDFLGGSDMLAYLSMMALRLIELRRVLKATGSIYLHCDPTASHYLKFIMDSIFGPENFRSEIIWRRTTAKGLAFKNYPKNHDVIFYYSKGPECTWNRPYISYDPENLDDKTAGKYSHVDSDGRRYQLDNLLNPNPNRPNLTYEFLGVKRVWRWTKERMQKAYEEGKVIQPSPGAVPRFKRYLDEQEGRPIDDVWVDIFPLNSQAQERLGYPTQKPELLLERMIKASSTEGDVVLDPFCGCGTSIAAAQKNNRRWIGIDVTHLAVNLIKVRLADAFGIKTPEYKVVGEPRDLESARSLAEADKYQFQYWALGLVAARPMEEKKGADKGIDGRLYMTDSAGETKTILISVKGGHVTVSQVRDLRGVIERDEAAIGVFICIEEPTAPMRKEAADAGFYQTESVGKSKHPRLQIFTIEDLLGGKKIDMPAQQDIRSFKQAPKAKGKKADEAKLF
jgi:site-specific DNA-methyltransferase (adenine-specific)